MPVVVNLPAIPNEETPAQAQATEELPVTKAENPIVTRMDNMMKAVEAWTFQPIKQLSPDMEATRIPGRTSSKLTIHHCTQQ